MKNWLWVMMVMSLGFNLSLLVEAEDMSQLSSDCSYGENDSDLISAQSNCSGANGIWDCSTNRCKANPEDKESVANIEKCNAIADDQQRNLCFEQLAKEASGYVEIDEDNAALERAKIFGLIQLVANAIIGDTTSANCMSLNVYSKTALANTLVSIGSYLMMDGDTTELRENYLKRAAGQSDQDAQIGAFEFLKKEQETVKKIAVRQELIHKLTAFGYTAASAIAVYEMFQPTAKLCQNVSKDFASQKMWQAALSAGAADINNGSLERIKTDKKLPVSKPSDVPQSSLPSNWFEEWANPSRHDLILPVMQKIAYDQSATDLDSLFLMNEKSDLYHSQSLLDYQKMKSENLFPGREMTELLVMAQEMIMSHAVAADFGEKAKNVAIGGKFTGESLLFGGGLAGSALRGVAVAAIIGPLATGMLSSLRGFLIKPQGILVLSGASALIQFDLASHHKKQADKAENNIKLLDETMAHFNATSARYCLSGRDDLSKPECYCYKEDGTKNTEHSNSQTCVAYWSRYDNATHKDPNAYGAISATDKMGCVTVTGVYDPSCKCKAYKDKITGGNACQKSYFTNLQFPTAMAKSGLGTLGNSLDNIYSGNSTSLGQVGTTNFANLAAKMSEMKKKVLDELNKKRIAEGKPPVVESAKDLEKIMRGLLGKVEISPQLAQSLDDVIQSNAHSLPPKALDAIKKAREKSGLYEYAPGKGVSQEQKKSNTPDFDFTNESRSFGIRGKVDEFMQKEYNYASSDITTGGGTSIFEIITLRYQKTGVEKLDVIEATPAENATPAEKTEPAN